MVEFDVFTNAYLNKVSSTNLIDMGEELFTEQADLFLLEVGAEFDRIFRPRTGLTFADRDIVLRQFNWDWPRYEQQMQKTKQHDYVSLDEVVDVVSEGMVYKWMKTYVYSGDALDAGNLLQTRDYTVHSPSSYMSALTSLYKTTKDQYDGLVNSFSYNHAPLRRLHM